MTLRHSIASLILLATVFCTRVEASPRYSPDWRVRTPFGHVGYGATRDDWAFFHPADGKVIEYQFFFGPLGVIETSMRPGAVGTIAILGVAALASLGYFTARRVYERRKHKHAA